MTNAESPEESAALPQEPDAPKILLEGKLLKLSRKKVWQERHFAFIDDHTLTYSHGNTEPTASFRITKDSGCRISEMFVEQKGKKELLYCFTITWERDEASDYSLPIDETAPDDISYVPSSQPDTPRSVYSSGNASRRSDKQHQQLQASDSFSNVKRKFFGKKSSKPRRQTSLELGSDYGSLSSAGISENGSPFGKPNKRTKSPTRVPSFVKMDTPEKFPDYKPIPDGEEINKNSPKQDSPNQQHLEHRDSINTKARGQKAHEDRHATEQGILEDAFYDKEKRKSKEVHQKVIEGTKIAAATSAAVGFGVLTAGAGIAAGLVVLGAAAAAGGTAGVADFGMRKLKKQKGVLTVATANFEKAKLWKSSLDAYLASDSIRMSSTWAQKFVAEGRKTIGAVVPHDIDLMAKHNDLMKAVQSKVKGAPENESEREHNLFLRYGGFSGDSALWQPVEGGWTSMFGPGAQSLRIFKEQKVEIPTKSKKIFRLAVGGATTSVPLKARVILNVHPLDAFMCLMSNGRLTSMEIEDKGFIPKSGHSASFRVIEQIDDHTDIVHLFFRKLYLFPSWTEPRDYVLFRYWRYEPDGSYSVCFESVEHPDCPPQPGFVRGIMHQVSTLAPTKKPLGRRRGQVGAGPECMLTNVVQVDPRGWVPTKAIPFLSNQTYVDAFGISALLQMLDIRDAVENDRFIDVSPDLNIPRYGSKAEEDGGKMANGIGSNEKISYDMRFADRERMGTSVRFSMQTLCGFENYPPSLSIEKWAEPDANSFVVRGPNYLKDRKKVNAGASIGRLVAVDLVNVDQPILSGMATHPKERIQRALKKEQELLSAGKQSDMPPFVFVVNIVLPGPPFYHAVFYYAVDDLSTIDGTDGTGSSKLCKEFLFGDSDEFRNKTFKLIPQIVEGNFIVRKAVGSTPAIMGTKLAQYYSRSERFVEVILDCGSSQVATGVIRLSLGYAKSLMVDMGFLLEADEEQYLPERIFGCARMKYPEFGPEYVRKAGL
mmetsp:Transcript_36831/g.89457  ORF Transcript_36831/g.89457 Transcript_36831/m.89457 type:complete len:996 (-) Transcript_36831:568-3555(-)